MTIDLNSLDTSTQEEQGAVMEILNPLTGEVLKGDDDEPQTITLLGENSRKVQLWHDRNARENLTEQVAEHTGQKVAKARMTLRERNIEKVVAATSDCHLYLDGQWQECTPENMRTIYRRLPFLYFQATAFMADMSKYLGNSPKAS